MRGSHSICYSMAECFWPFQPESLTAKEGPCGPVAETFCHWVTYTVRTAHKLPGITLVKTLFSPKGSETTMQVFSIWSRVHSPRLAVRSYLYKYNLYYPPIMLWDIWYRWLHTFYWLSYCLHLPVFAIIINFFLDPIAHLDKLFCSSP